MKNKLTYVLIGSFLIFSIVIPFYFDSGIKTKEDKINEIQGELDLLFMKYQDFHIWRVKYEIFKSTYNILVAFQELNNSPELHDTIGMYDIGKDDRLRLGLIDLASVVGVPKEEIESLNFDDTDKLNEKISELLELYAERLNEKFDKISTLKEGISCFNLIKKILIGIGLPLNVYGIYLSEKKIIY